MRRFASIVLPNLLCELAAPPASVSKRPLGVVLRISDESLAESTKLDAVNEAAHRLGLRQGLSIAEAHAYVACLEVKTVFASQVRSALESMAEALLSFSPTVCIQSPDVLFVDLSGMGSLHGGEARSKASLQNLVSDFGHSSRIAIASGPRLAELLARHGPVGGCIVDKGKEAQSLRDLPVLALPIDQDMACWFARVGVLTLGDLVALPSDQLTARLAGRASEIIDLASGRDPTLLEPWTPPLVLREEAFWDEGVDSLSSLLFILNRLCSRLAKRLQGRGQALLSLSITLQHDPSLARFRGCEERIVTQLHMPAPLNRAEDLLRVMRSRLEALAWQAPVVGLCLEGTSIVDAPHKQLDLSHRPKASPTALPVLLAKLVAEVGPHRVGTLCLHHAHRPESRSTLQPFPSSCKNAFPSPPTDITRLLPTPIVLGQSLLRPAQALRIEDFPAMQVESLHFDTRFHDVEWWTQASCSRDYFRVWLMHDGSGASAWIYRDRSRNLLLLQGWSD